MKPSLPQAVNHKLFAALLICGTSFITSAQVHNWQRINTGYRHENGDTKFIVTKKSIYIFNSNYSTLIRSTDRGLTWDSLSIPSDSLSYRYGDMVFVNDSVGYLCGYDGSVFSGYPVKWIVKKTTNRGLSWQKANNGISGNYMLRHINFADANNGIVFANGSDSKTHRYETTNGGASWTYYNDTKQVPEINMSIVNFSSISGNNWFASGHNGFLAVSSSNNTGKSWATRQFKNSGICSGLKFFDASNGIVLVNDSIFITGDGAATFSAKRKFPYTNFIRSFDMISNNKGFFCTDTAIYYTPDAGITWQLSFSDGSLQLNHIKIEGQEIFACSFGDSILLRLDISGLTGISENKSALKEVNIFPNPAGGKVFASLPTGIDSAELVLRDGLGRTVFIQRIENSNEIDISGLAPGIYLVQINTNEDIKSTRLIVRD